MEYKKIVRKIQANRKTTLRQQVEAIKQNVSAGQYNEALKMHPLYLTLVHQEAPFFKMVQDVQIKHPFAFTNNFRKEIRWVANLLTPYLSIINEFIYQKNKFEQELILCKYEDANKTLLTIEKSFGVTLWSIEANFIIKEHLTGSKGNWNELSYYLKEINNSVYEFIINSSSKRAESKLTYESYLSQFQNDLDNIRSVNVLKDFFVFKNCNISNYSYQYENLEGVLYVSNAFSVIDRYLILMDVILYNIAKTVVNDKPILQFVNSAKSVILNDERLGTIYNILNTKGEIDIPEGSQEYLTCFNSYYQGKFKESLKLSLNGIQKHPLEFEYYSIYCKSILNLDLEFQSSGISEMIDTTLENVFDILSFRKDRESSFPKLLKSSLFFMNSSFGKQIFGLIAEVEGVAQLHDNIGILSSKFISYKTEIFSKARPYIKDNLYKLSHEHCFKVYSYKLGDAEISFEDEISESKHQTVSSQVKRLFNLKEYSKVIELLIKSVELDNSLYYYERKLRMLFFSYVELGMIREALILFGEIYFNDSIVVRNLDIERLYQIIDSQGSKEEFYDLIEFSVLASLLVKEFDLYEIYDEFMCSTEIFDIDKLELDSFIEKYSLKTTIVFLEKISTIDTLKYSTDFGSISDVEQVRVNILKKLMVIAPDNKLMYEKELNKIYRITSVRKVLKEVDEGRLYIDIDKLKEIQVKKFSDEFLRFKEIETFSESETIIGFNPSNTKDWDYALNQNQEEPETYNSADYLALKSIYLESRNNFLYSKEYGLDSCLSTRIRHGALKNHLRSVFEKLDLVTSKFKDRYKDNELWGAQLVSCLDINYQVQSVLKEFSKKIDDYTIYIVDHLIQIQTEKRRDKENGLFAFFTNDEILFDFYNKNKHLFDSVESTINLILTSLTQHTLIEIQTMISHHFSDVILKKYQEIIDQTIRQLRNLNLPSQCQLLPYLIKSNTDIQNELKNVSNWFYLNTTSSTTLLSIETVVDATVELTNQINPNYPIKPKIKFNCEEFGVYSSLLFVFNILFNNIIQHSHLSAEEIDIKIDFDTIDEKYIRMSVSNNIAQNYNFSSNLEKLATIKENWNDHSNIERSNKEGESGFDKIKRMLLYETHSKSDRFDYEFKNNLMSIHLYFPFTKIKDNE